MWLLSSLHRSPERLGHVKSADTWRKVAALGNMFLIRQAPADEVMPEVLVVLGEQRAGAPEEADEEMRNAGATGSSGNQGEPNDHKKFDCVDGADAGATVSTGNHVELIFNMAQRLQREMLPVPNNTKPTDQKKFDGLDDSNAGATVSTGILNMAQRLHLDRNGQKPCQ